MVLPVAFVASVLLLTSSFVDVNGDRLSLTSYSYNKRTGRTPRGTRDHDVTTAVLHLQMKALKSCHSASPLGLISGDVADWQISSSSVLDGDSECSTVYGRLYLPNGVAWCAHQQSSSEWLQVDLGVLSKVTGLMTQGRGDGKQWVTSFTVSFREHESMPWKFITDQYGNRRVFDGNTDSYTAKHSYLDDPIATRFVKFHTIRWHGHPSLRVEIIGCQACNQPITLLSFCKMTASSERLANGSESSVNHVTSCRATDGNILSSKAWCPRRDNVNQWLQFDVGPPTLVTGVVTKGRGDLGHASWVVRYRLSHSNDSRVWYFYRESSKPRDNKEFGGNSDKDLERKHYLSSPFIARFVRLHPTVWHQHIGLRAGLLGCPRTGECERGFMRINEYTPCVENVALLKETWMTEGRSLKRHVIDQSFSSPTSDAAVQWKRGGQAAKAVDGIINSEDGQAKCAFLNSLNSERPLWMVDLGRRMTITGVVVVTNIIVQTELDDSSMSGSSATDPGGYNVDNLDQLVFYVDKRLAAGKSSPRQTTAAPMGPRRNTSMDSVAGVFPLASVCGTVSNRPGGLFDKTVRRGTARGGNQTGRRAATEAADGLERFHVPCSRPMIGRYVYIEGQGRGKIQGQVVSNERVGVGMFSVALCEVMVYQ